MERKPMVIITILLLLVLAAGKTTFFTVGQSPLELTLATDKSSYTYREKVEVIGNLSLDGMPSDGFVGIEVNPLNQIFSNFTHFLTRTATIGNSDIGTRNITVESLTTTDSSTPPHSKTTFKIGEKLGVNVTVINNYVDDRTVVIAITASDNDSTPLASEVAHIRTTILGNGGKVKFYPQFSIPTWASLGSAEIYADVYSDWPSLGGVPWCSERNATFTIAPATSSFFKSSHEISSENSVMAISEHSYAISFRLPPNAPEGNYSVNANAYAKGWVGNDNTTFVKPYQILGDVDFDHRITILDIVRVAAVYGSKSGDSDWNPMEDLAPNGKVDIFDIVTITAKYGLKY